MIALKTRTSSAKIMKNLREERRVQGLCPGCGEKNDRPGRYYCSNCAEEHNKRKRIWRQDKIAADICPVCGGELDRDGFSCTTCKERNMGFIEELKRKYREQGLCERCGKYPPKEGAKYCEKCAQRENLTRQIRRGKKV